MKIEIEQVNNGYIIKTLDNHEESEDFEYVVKSTYVVEEKEEGYCKLNEYESFNRLVQNIQDIFGVYNSKHNNYGFISGVCSEDKRWQFQEDMITSLKSPKNDLGD